MSTEDPKDIKEEFWDHVEAFERAEWRPLSAVLSEMGVALPPPEELDDVQIGEKLWEIVNALALLGAFLYNTDHLSDRDLYGRLWHDILPEPTVLIPENPAFAQHIDLVGSGSEEHNQLYLKYYADEQERQSWLEDWPGDPLPEPEEPSYDRDRLLPKAEEFRKERPVM